MTEKPKGLLPLIGKTIAPALKGLGLVDHTPDEAIERDEFGIPYLGVGRPEKPKDEKPDEDWLKSIFS